VADDLDVYRLRRSLMTNLRQGGKLGQRFWMRSETEGPEWLVIGVCMLQPRLRAKRRLWKGDEGCG
jgi:hypothetical protein